MRLTVIIPAYNEAAVIGETLSRLEREIRTPHEVIVVADHCSDATEERVKDFARSYPTVRLVQNFYEKGFGNALITGFEHARTELVVPLMADNCDDPATIDRMAHLMMEKRYDAVFASRYMRGGERKGGSLVLKIFSPLVCGMLRIITGIPTWDVANSFKMYHKDTLERVGFALFGRGTDYSLWLALRVHFVGAKIVEIPTTWRGGRIPLVREPLMFKRTPGYAKAMVVAFIKTLKKIFRKTGRTSAKTEVASKV